MNEDGIIFGVILVSVAMLIGGMFGITAYGALKKVECVALVANKPAIEIQAICK